MLFKITQDIVEACINGNQACVQILDMLSWAILHQKHIVFGEANTLKWIIDQRNDNWKGFEYIFNQYSTIGAIVAYIDWHAEFVFETPSRKDIESKTIYINIADIPRFEILKETHFLCENIKDIDFYRYVLKYYQRQHSCQCNINFYPILGGGGTTFSMYQNEITEKKAFVLCVTDGDQKYENAALGDTWNNVKRVEDRNHAFNSFCYHLSNVSEVENLVPFPIYKKYIIRLNDEELKAHFVLLEELSQKKVGNLAYFDYKSGVSLHLLEDSNNNNNWIDAVELVNPSLKEKMSEDKQRIEDLRHQLQQLKKPECDKFAILVVKEMQKVTKYVCGLGDKILDNVLNTCQDDLNLISKEMLFDFQEKEYESVGYLMHNWACCLGLVRS